MLCPEVPNPPVQGRYMLDKLMIHVRLRPTVKTSERFLHISSPCL